MPGERRRAVRRGMKVAVILCILTLVLAACGGGSGAPTGAGDPAPSDQPPDTIKIGYSLAASGLYAGIGHGQHLAVQYWAETVNERGGLYVPEFDQRIPVELVYYDDESSTEKMLENYNRLLDVDRVHLLFPPAGTTLHIAVAPFAEQRRVPIVGSTAASGQLRDLDVRYMWFTTGAMPDRQMQALVDLLAAQGDEIQSVAVAYTQLPYPRENFEALMPALEAAGFEVKAVVDYPPSPSDLSSVVLQLRDAQPDAVLALTYPDDTFLLTQQAAEYGLNPKVFQMLVGPALAAYTDAFNEDGVVFMGEWSPNAAWPGAREFWDGFIKRWNERPDLLDSTLAFQAAQVMEQAVEAVGLDWERLRDYIADNEFMTIRGPTRFEGVENVGTPSMWLQWQGTEAHIVWPEEFATSRLVLPKPEW